MKNCGGMDPRGFVVKTYAEIGHIAVDLRKENETEYRKIRYTRLTTCT